MTTKQIAERYFASVKEKSDWQVFIAENIRFESPAPTTLGKNEYVIAASRFFGMVETLELWHLFVEESKVCAWVDYLLSKSGKTFTCTVCELLTTDNDHIVSSTILFDTLALKAFTSAN